MLFEALKILAWEEESSLFSPDQFAGYAVTIVLTIINVLVGFLVIKFLLYKPLIKMIHKRQEALNAELDAAAKAKEEADKVVAESKKTIDDAKSQAAQILEEARENAGKTTEAVIEKANEEAAKILERAEDDCARMKRVALENMKDDITDLAVEIAEHVIGDAVPRSELMASAQKHTDVFVDAEVRKGE